MPRLARKNQGSSFLHIIIQGINKENIFQDSSLKLAYKSLFKRNLDNTNINIIAYCIMSNHMHILLYSESYKEVSSLMQKTNTAYARFYNKINKRIGYVFRDRYYVQPIMNEKHLYNCLVYIHNNPINAKIVTNPSKYTYSSYNEYIGKKDLITEESIILAFGSTKNYMDTFIQIHKDTEIEDIKDVVEEYISPEKVINSFLIKYNTLENVKDDETLLSELLILLRRKCRIIIT